MSWKDRCLSFVKKYGKAAKTVASGVLNVVAPGSGALIGLVEQACDKAGDTAQDDWELSLLQATQNNTAELERLGQLFEMLNGGLAKLCDQAFDSKDRPDLPAIVRAAIADNPSLSQVLHQVDTLKTQFTVFQADLRRIAQHQEEAIPVYARMNRMADYFDELWQAGIKPKDFAQQLLRHQEVVVRIERGETRDLEPVIRAIRTTTPKAASVCCLEAAAATREFNYPAAQRALATALRLRPGDGELLDLSRRVTILATKVTPGPGPGDAKPAPGTRLQPGDTLDGWLLEARLGAGGWGQVFKATRQGQSRAIKVMHPEFAADEAFVGRFKQEIASLLRLPRHPNLVGIEASSAFGYCTARRTWYLAMEYIDGPTLESYLAAQGPLTEGQACKLFLEVIAGLADAHKAGIVHRDIKPSNLILRQQDNRLVFVDFGLAVGVEELGQTKVGGISILFAAPEQHYGESATQASDVFSLCAVIHYALNYDKPALRKPNRFAPALVPEALRAALAQGMKSNADERFRDASQLLAAFRSIRPTPVSPPTPEGKKNPSDGKVGTTISNSLGMQFAWVPPGESWLGGYSKPGTKKFALEEGLWCGVYLVTQAEWEAVTGNNPSEFGGNPRYPVENVSWHDVQEFIEELNQRAGADGLLYRLPTEKEWEYICRGGPLSQEQSKYHFYFARSKTDLTPVPTNSLSSKQANFHGDYPAGLAAKGPYLECPCDVGLYSPNPLGIYDLHGNLWEWTATVKGSDRVIRGGCWADEAVSCAASVQDFAEPEYAGCNVGFRLLAVPSS